MNNAIIKVLNRKEDIINMTMEYQNYYSVKNKLVSLDDIDVDITPSGLFDFFDKNFNSDEIMVIQSIMYFGRECFSHDGYYCGETTNEIISNWMEELSFSFGKQIVKDREINQMLGKELKIGTYFKLGFENLK